MEFLNQVLRGDCLEVLKDLPNNTFDSVVTDVPYGLGTKEPAVEELVAYLQGEELDTGGDFMGKRWAVPSVAVWKEVYRVLKPGGYVLCFGGTRTFDLISLGLRAANFEYRDTCQWLYGQGFPKSLNVSKAIDKAAGAEREVVGTYRVSGNALTPTKDKGGTYVTGAPNSPAGDLEITAPATEDAERWDGYGTALKPAWEPILVFRKPLEGTVVENVLKHGTGAMNIDATRVGNTTRTNSSSPRKERSTMIKGMVTGTTTQEHDHGRWPPNVVMSHAEGCERVGTKKAKASSRVAASKPITAVRRSGVHSEVGGHQTIGRVQPVFGYGDEDGTETVESWECVEGCPVKALDEQTGECRSAGAYPSDALRTTNQSTSIAATQGQPYADTGGASRFFPQFEGQEPASPTFFYTGKATKKEKEGWADGQNFCRLRETLTSEDLEYVKTEMKKAGFDV